VPFGESAVEFGESSRIALFHRKLKKIATEMTISGRIVAGFAEKHNSRFCNMTKSRRELDSR